MMTQTVSIPLGKCSKEMSLFSRIVSRRFTNPISEFIIFLYSAMTTKSFLPATPVIIFCVGDGVSDMIVPGFSGSFVFRILIGIFTSLTGKTASS